MKRHYLKRFILAGGVSWLAMTGAAFATYQEAMQALSEKDYVFAIEEFTRLADKEQNADARYQLGHMYEMGAGVPKDEIKAMQIYQQAADEGSGQAALKIGNAYYTGKGMDKNYVEAFKWYEKASARNSYPAQYNIGLMLEEGLGVKKDLIRSFESYKKSADQGYAPAQMALGRMYLKGLGTPQDFSKAIFWYKLAADQGNIEAQMELAKLYANTTVRGLPFNVVGAHVYFNLVSAYGSSPLKEEAALKRNELTQKMKNEEVLQAQSKAQQWKKKTREESLPELVQEATLLEEESGIVPTEKQAPKEQQKEEIKITVDTDIQEIIVAAGISRRDLNKAVREDNFQPIVDALNKQITDGNKIARLALADLYMLGQGMQPNPKEAFKIYTQMVQENDPIAFYRLAPMYCEGNAVDPDLAECYKLMVLAKKYADEASLQSVSESLQMLDENLDKEIRDAGKKLADQWGVKQEDKKGEKKKGMFGFFGGESDEEDAMEKPKEEETKKEEKTEEETKTEEKKEDTPEKENNKKEPEDDFEEDLFSDL